MRLVVTDANIFIDLAAGSLLEEMFRLPEVEFCVPDTLYVEELADQYGILPGLGLQIHPQSAEAVEYIAELRLEYRGPSTNDLFALALARGLNCPLLSGDLALRNAARSEGVEVRGTLWLIEALLEAGVIGVTRARTAYEEMRRDGSRLPWEEVEIQLEKWQAQS